MKRPQPALVTMLALAATLALGPPGSAGTEASPEVVDIAGDANLVNGQNFGDINQSTEPASIPSADLRAMWFETAYEKRIETVGETRWVRYDPTALVLRIKTTAPSKPTIGPSVIFRYPALIGECSVFLEVWIKGSSEGAVDREYAAINRVSGCPGGVTPGFPVSVTGNVTTATFPFAQTAETLGDGMFVMPDATLRPHVRLVLGSGNTYCCTIPVVDDAPVGAEFEIGPDVPADVSCADQPSHPDCA